MRGDKVVGLGQARVRRLDRRIDGLERTMREVDERLAEVSDLLTRLVRVVAAQHRKRTREIAHLDERLERIARAVTSGRTADLRRLAAIERRLR